MSNGRGMQVHAPEMTFKGDSDSGIKQSRDDPQADEKNSSLKEELLKHVASSKAIFKSQQKDDPDLTFEEKLTIARNIFNRNHCLFLSKFGHYLNEQHLNYFEDEKGSDYGVSYHINRLRRYFNNSTRQVDVKNRRYQALKMMIDKGEYFSECEMMKRNPLLYEQLVGQYMTEKQKKIRDNIDTTNITFVNLLMESMERDSIKEKKKLQEQEEQNALEETDSDEESNETCLSSRLGDKEEKFTLWGKIPELENTGKSEDIARVINRSPHSISSAERQILKEEFVSYMYQCFLDGKDTDFDYSTVDENETYDNIDLRTQDEEEKYFDSESPETLSAANDAKEIDSEDELDVYMQSLKEPIAISTFSTDNQT